jgi:hypothetical protein
MPGKRSAVAVGLAAVLVAPVSAWAGPGTPPSCNLIRDPAGDTSSEVPNDVDRELDITSADVAVIGDEVVVALRLTHLAAADPTEAQGRTYEFDFTAKERNFIVMGSLLTGASTFDVFISDQRLEEGKSGGRAGTGIGSAVGIVDTVRNELRMRAPVKIFEPYAPLRKGTALYDLSAFTYRANGMAMDKEGVPVHTAFSGGLGVDQAWGRSASYRVGRTSCLKP